LVDLQQQQQQQQQQQPQLQRQWMIKDLLVFIQLFWRIFTSFWCTGAVFSVLYKEERIWFATRSSLPSCCNLFKYSKFL
jgi:hypothetical protein